MKTLIALIILMASVSVASANMPPREYDNADNSMTIAEIKATLHVKKTRYKRVVYGHAGEYCPNKPRFGCTNVYDDGSALIVYSYDPKEGVDGVMAKNVLRHEIGHRKGWPSDHPNALP